MHIFEQKLVISFWKGEKLLIFFHKYFSSEKFKKIGILGQKNGRAGPIILKLSMKKI